MRKHSEGGKIFFYKISKGEGSPISNEIRHKLIYTKVLKKPQNSPITELQALYTIYLYFWGVRDFVK